MARKSHLGTLMRSSLRRSSETPSAETPEAALCRRAWRHRRRGEERRAMVALREAALSNEQDARLWTLYGAQCLRVGRTDSAREALTHAAWLRDRRGEPGKARSTRRLLDGVTAWRAA